MLVSYKTAKLAFDKGVIIPSENCFPLNAEADLEDGSKFMDFIPRPHQHKLQKVLREVHNIYVSIIPKIFNTNEPWFSINIQTSNYEIDICGSKTYEESLEEGLLQALKIINP